MAYSTASAADKAAIDAFIAANPNATIQSVAHDGTEYLIVYTTAPAAPAVVYRDAVNTEAIVNKLD